MKHLLSASADLLATSTAMVGGLLVTQSNESAPKPFLVIFGLLLMAVGGFQIVNNHTHHPINRTDDTNWSGPRPGF